MWSAPARRGAIAASVPTVGIDATGAREAADVLTRLVEIREVDVEAHIERLVRMREVPRRPDVVRVEERDTRDLRPERVEAAIARSGRAGVRLLDDADRKTALRVAQPFDLRARGDWRRVVDDDDLDVRDVLLVGDRLQRPRQQPGGLLIERDDDGDGHETLGSNGRSGTMRPEDTFVEQVPGRRG